MREPSVSTNTHRRAVINLAAIADILFTATVVFLAYNLGSVNRRLKILETWINSRTWRNGMNIKKTKRPPNSRWSMKIEESYKGCPQSSRCVKILFDGEVIMYMNYALDEYKSVIAKRLVSDFNRAGVVVELPKFDDDGGSVNE